MTMTRDEQKAHREARRLVALARHLTEDEKDTVAEHWQESSSVTNKLDGAHFTPLGLASDLRFHVVGTRIIDLCAGVGRLAYAARELYTRGWEGLPPREIVCVEKNPDYVTVGRKLMPEARWIVADVLTMDTEKLGLGEFDTAIANPPFGPRVERHGFGPRYRGDRFEFHVIDRAATLARHGAFIIPQQSAPFQYSGRPSFQYRPSEQYARFHRETGLTLGENIGIDTSYHGYRWRGVSPTVEVVTADFTDPASGLLPAPPSRASRGGGTLR
ncbi:methyltransferase [Streptomyces sp. SPB4]|uniref:methyltransferase n=1 Tax=Streptomyces sp. SPB4 TaxID=2940553 RepID=UPI0024754908|nr:methyltransferase [Streptomyces sp. SPB4]MDH6544161.1 hypothetical protein [Streptomyces sp. SPB4]